MAALSRLAVSEILADQVEAALPLLHHRRLDPAEAFDDLHDVGCVDPVARDLVGLDDDLEARQTGHLLRLEARGPGNPGDGGHERRPRCAAAPPCLLRRS